MQIQEPEKAVRAFEAAMEFNPKDSDLIVRVARAQVITHDYQRAIDYYNKASEGFRALGLRVHPPRACMPPPAASTAAPGAVFRAAFVSNAADAWGREAGGGLPLARRCGFSSAVARMGRMAGLGGKLGLTPSYRRLLVTAATGAFADSLRRPSFRRGATTGFCWSWPSCWCGCGSGARRSRRSTSERMG